MLDLGLGVAGPFTGRMLADLGADVIKVNALYDSFWNGTHMGLGINRGKRSISLNLKDDQGKAILHRLIAQADVVTTNWRPGAAARLGIDYASLRGQFPRLIFCNTRGYEKGPRSALPGTDQNAAALTGTEWEDGACDAGNPPLWSRSNMGDTGNALLAAIAITSALFHRDRTGEGQEVATAIVNAGLLHTSYAWVHADGSPGDYHHVDGDQVGFSAHYRMYRAADDRWLFVAALSEDHRKLLTEVTGAVSTEADDAVDGALARALADRFVRLSQRPSGPPSSRRPAFPPRWSTRNTAAPSSTTRRRVNGISWRRPGRAASVASRTPACWCRSPREVAPSSAGRACVVSTPGRSSSSTGSATTRSTAWWRPGPFSTHPWRLPAPESVLELVWTVAPGC